MTFNDLSSPLALLRTRRSGKPREMVAPGPAPDQLLELVRVAARTPDHGKLAPWRFAIVAEERRPALGRRSCAPSNRTRPIATWRRRPSSPPRPRRWWS
jgi:nitroreductase